MNLEEFLEDGWRSVCSPPRGAVVPMKRHVQQFVLSVVVGSALALAATSMGSRTIDAPPVSARAAPGLSEQQLDVAWEEALRILATQGEDVEDVIAQGQKNIAELRRVDAPIDAPLVLPEDFRLFG